MTTATKSELNLETIESLLEKHDGWCVSIYIPTHRAGKDIREDPIRLKNRLAEAEEQLEKAGVDTSEIRQLCESARQRCDFDQEQNREFWRHQTDSLAILLNGSDEHLFHLQRTVNELTLVARRFHIKPLLRAVQQDQEYCVLAVSRDRVRFMEGSGSGLSERPVEDLPESLQAVVSGEHQKGFNLHSFRVSAAGGDNAVPHGHVETNDEHELRRFFRTIDEALSDALKDDKRPLIFAGVDELFPYFRDTTEYSNLVPDPVQGNPDDLSDEQLHEKAWPVVQQVLQKKQDEAVHRWGEAAHTDIAEHDLTNIVLAAHDGRIDQLLLAEDATQWGTFDSSKRTVHTQEAASADNYDLLDLAAAKTLLADGDVVFVDADRLPDGHRAAAICRYPLRQQ